MKKGKVKWFIIFIIGILLGIFLVQSQIIKSNKNKYNTGESVYVLSTISSNDKLCRSNPGEEVSLYIVENKEEWTEGNVLNDVREEIIKVPNSRFSNKKVWDNVKPGDYDLVIDCNEDENYNIGEPLYNQGFTVVTKIGTGVVLNGDIEIKDFSWRYDSEEVSLNNEILQVKLSAENENIKLNNITIEFMNKPDLDAGLGIYIDKNNNGNLDSIDVKIGEFEPEVIKDNEKKTIFLDYVLNNKVPESILIVYKMKQNTSLGNYSLRVISLEGDGESSGKVIKFSGLPINSNKINILSEKDCLGTPYLSFSIDPAPKDSDVIVKISNLTGCDEKKVFLKETPCYSPLAEKDSCIFKNKTCELSLKMQENKTYYICIDKNSDNDMVDFGEFASKELVLLVEETEKPSILNKTENNKTEKINLNNKITGEALKEVEKETKTNIFQDSGSFFILLEVTLLLILFVLIMILFKLRVPMVEEVKEIHSKQKTSENVKKKKKVESVESEEESDDSEIEIDEEWLDEE